MTLVIVFIYFLRLFYLFSHVFINILSVYVCRYIYRHLYVFNSVFRDTLPIYVYIHRPIIY